MCQGIHSVDCYTFQLSNEDLQRNGLLSQAPASEVDPSIHFDERVRMLYKTGCELLESGCIPSGFETLVETAASVLSDPERLSNPRGIEENEAQLLAPALRSGQDYQEEVARGGSTKKGYDKRRRQFKRMRDKASESLSLHRLAHNSRRFTDRAMIAEHPESERLSNSAHSRNGYIGTNIRSNASLPSGSQGLSLDDPELSDFVYLSRQEM